MALIYLDSSAILKLVLLEAETRALFAYLREGPERVSSVVAAVEVPRSVRRVSGSKRAVRRADRVLTHFNLVELDARIRTRAAMLDPPRLRSIDAIHIATVLDLGDDVDAMITYDDRQASAAEATGVKVQSPGRG